MVSRRVGFDDAAFAVDPGGFDGVEPGALDRQVAGDDPDAVAALLDLAVVVADPVAHLVADVPGGVVPDQEQRLLAVGVELAAAPVQVVDGDGADRPAIDEAQPHLVGGVLVGRVGAQQQAVAGQRLGVRVVLRDRLFDQPQSVILLDPGVEAGSSQTAPPDLILEAQDPGRMARGQADQAVARTFFRAYSGSGLVIHCLARFQRTPRRRIACRIVSPLTRSAVIPSAKLTSAARSSVHTLVGLPNVRGLWCSSARSCSSATSSTFRWMVWGRLDPRVRHASSPASLEFPHHVPHRLVRAAQHLGDARRPLPSVARQQDLAPPHLVQVLRAQTGFRAAPAPRRSTLRTMMGGLIPTIPHVLDLSQPPILRQHFGPNDASCIGLPRSPRPPDRWAGVAATAASALHADRGGYVPVESELQRRCDLWRRHDPCNDPNESVLVTSSGSTSVVSATNPRTDSGPNGEPLFSADIALSPPSQQTVTVNYTIITQPGVTSFVQRAGMFARLPLDPVSRQAATPGPVAFQPGEATKTVTSMLPIGFVGRVTLTITGATSATIGNPSVSLVVGAPPGAAPAPIPPPVRSQPDDDTDDPPEETEDERRQRGRTNRSSQDDVHTEGNVIAVDKAPDGKSLLATISLTRGETLVVQVPCSGDRSNVTCPDIQVGDYLEADGEQHGVGDPDSYFVASESFEVTRNGKKVK